MKDEQLQTDVINDLQQLQSQATKSKSKKRKKTIDLMAIPEDDAEDSARQRPLASGQTVADDRSNWQCTSLLRLHSTTLLVLRCLPRQWMHHVDRHSSQWQNRTPSRHIPLNQPEILQDAVQRLHAANEMGWGAFVAMGLRRRGLKRYQSRIVALIILSLISGC